MDLWETRRASMALMDSDLSDAKVALTKAFGLLDSCIIEFNQYAPIDGYSRICGLALAKARNYALGAYGMILDNLGQEAGALMRPFLEYYELLIYFSQDPSRVDQVAENKLPNAGKRARIIGSEFQGFRNYLSENASHSSYSLHSMRHLLEIESSQIKPHQQFAPEVLFRNLGDFFAQLILLCFQAGVCLNIKDNGKAIELSEKTALLRDEGGVVFKLKERLAAKYEPARP